MCFELNPVYGCSPGGKQEGVICAGIMINRIKGQFCSLLLLMFDVCETAYVIDMNERK